MENGSGQMTDVGDDQRLQLQWQQQSL